MWLYSGKQNVVFEFRGFRVLGPHGKHLCIIWTELIVLTTIQRKPKYAFRELQWNLHFQKLRFAKTSLKNKLGISSTFRHSSFRAKLPRLIPTIYTFIIMEVYTLKSRLNSFREKKALVFVSWIVFITIAECTYYIICVVTHSAIYNISIVVLVRRQLPTRFFFHPITVHYKLKYIPLTHKKIARVHASLISR